MRLRVTLKEQGEHLLFAVAVGSLLVLGLWWMRLLTVSVEASATAARSALVVELERAARDPSLRDERFVFVPASAASSLAVSADQPGFYLDVAPPILDALGRHTARRRLMVAGEGSLLFVLLAVVTVMLYRLVAARAAVEREMGYFVGQMTHEMKTPLAGLKALLETLQRGRIPDEELPELVALGLQQVEREEHLVQSLLQAQRLRVAREPLRSEVLPLDDLVPRFVAHRACAALRAEVHDAPVVRGDADAVWSILENLVDNALKYGARSIELTAREVGRDVVVACVDDGLGWSREGGVHLFQPFRSAHRDGAARHGTGLGLYLGRRLARAMGGELTGASEGEGRGARFELRLPRERA